MKLVLQATLAILKTSCHKDTRGGKYFDVPWYSLANCANGYKYARLFNAHLTGSAVQIPRDSAATSELSVDSDIYLFSLLCSKLGQSDSIR